MKENIEKKKKRVLGIIEVFDKVYGDADCTLDYTSALQLLIATQLAAQCTDARVNLVTPALFERYKTVEDFALADRISQQYLYSSVLLHKPNPLQHPMHRISQNHLLKTILCPLHHK